MTLQSYLVDFEDINSKNLALDLTTVIAEL